MEHHFNWHWYSPPEWNCGTFLKNWNQEWQTTASVKKWYALRRSKWQKQLLIRKMFDILFRFNIFRCTFVSDANDFQHFYAPVKRKKNITHNLNEQYIFYTFIFVCNINDILFENMSLIFSCFQCKHSTYKSLIEKINRSENKKVYSYYDIWYLIFLFLCCKFNFLFIKKSREFQ